jgi:hypothetical protein
MKHMILLLPSLVIGLLALSAIIPNALLFLEVIQKKRENYSSPIMVVGGLLGAVSVCLFPPIGFKFWAILPVLLDWGCVVVVLSLYFSLKEKNE